MGPTSEGLIPEPSIQRLAEIGDWMDVNGEAIYGTTASPFSNLPWGRCTKKVTDAGTTLYLHVFEWPEDGRLVVPGLSSPVERAYLLARPDDALETDAADDGVVVNVGGTAPDPISSTVVLDVAGEVAVSPAE